MARCMDWDAFLKSTYYGLGTRVTAAELGQDGEFHGNFYVPVGTFTLTAHYGAWRAIYDEKHSAAKAEADADPENKGLALGNSPALAHAHNTHAVPMARRLSQR